MSARFNPRWIIGKTIASVEMRPFDATGPDETIRRERAHNPLITFTDGSSIAFQTEETCDEYGTDIVYIPKRKGA